MQYVFSMTSRMVTIALTCALLLCVLLFLLGVEIGARFVTGPAHSAPSLSASPAAGAGSFAPALSPAQGEPASGSSSNS
ncbi:MAG TPA: hypothetical protein VGG24_21080 [Paraburkholderia sp.]